MKSEIYTFLELIKKFNKIEIPIIQRNYAQGREKEKSIRKNFLADIISVLNTDEKSKKLNLDFVYGTTENGKFIPIDGQQRLTTLFLIHWYIFIRKEKNKNLKELLTKFSYETRESSKQFCENLVKDYNEYDNQEKCGQISEKIKNQIWFFQEWNNDPTIDSMLNMLDYIEESFNAENVDIDRVARRLEDKIIYFHFIEIKDFGTQEELYIKMNSRGKRLTYYEKFKSKLEDYINNPKNKSKLDSKITENFADKIDKEWLNIFWEIFKENQPKAKIEDIDNWLMNLFMAIFENYYAVEYTKKIEDKTFKENIKNFDDFHTGESIEELTFENLKDDLKCLNEKTIEQIYYLLEYFSDLNKKENKYSEFVNKEKLLKTIIDVSKSKNNMQKCYKIQLYAIYKYVVIKNKENAEINELELSRILYFVRNITENLYIDNAENYSKIIKLIDRVIENSQRIGIFPYLKQINLEEEKNRIGNTDISNLLKAECKKAQHIEDVKWENEILKADKLSYFNGNTGFLFEFIDNYKENCIGTKENLQFDDYNLYKNYSQKIRTIFRYAKNNEDTTDHKEVGNEVKIDPISNNNNYYFKRALLYFGNYLYPVSGRYSFLRCNDTDKYHSWKKLLKYQAHPKEIDVIRKLLDEMSKYISLKEENEDNSLDKLYQEIEQWLQKFVDEKVEELDKFEDDIYYVGNWTKYCVKYPQLIGLVNENTGRNNIGYLKIMRDSDEKSIFIMNGKNITSYNWDFYIYALKLRIEEKMNKEYHTKIDLKCESTKYNKSNKFIEYISPLYGSIKLQYNYVEKNQEYYSMKFNNNEIKNNEIKKILEGFNVSFYTEGNEFVCKFETEKEIINAFTTLHDQVC